MRSHIYPRFVELVATPGGPDPDMSITFLHSRADRDDTPVEGRVELILEGKPQGKDRARSGRHGFYTPKATKLAEANIIAAWTEAGCPRLEGPIHLGLSLVVTRAQDHYLRSGELSAKGARLPYPTGRKPDLDNALKLACDALNGRLYRDDVDIVEMTGLRYWSDDGWERTVIRAWSL
jgi:Holliday junction resolvase RusA-like endonuclease